MYNRFLEDELYHHGILGQKWGVRRFQNPDGTLTAAGKKRYLNDDGTLNKKGQKFEIKNDTKIKSEQDIRLENFKKEKQRIADEVDKECEETIDLNSKLREAGLEFDNSLFRNIEKILKNHTEKIYKKYNEEERTEIICEIFGNTKSQLYDSRNDALIAIDKKDGKIIGIYEKYDLNSLLRNNKDIGYGRASERYKDYGEVFRPKHLNTALGFGPYRDIDYYDSRNKMSDQLYKDADDEYKH